MSEPNKPATPPVPEGYAPVKTKYGFVEWVGPLYGRSEADGDVLGLRIDLRHCNAGNVAHGGMIAAMADIAIGYHLVRSAHPPRWSLTLSLTTEFMGVAPLGAWLVARPSLRRVGSRIAFVGCELSVDGKAVAMASSVLKMLSEPGERSNRVKSSLS